MKTEVTLMLCAAIVASACTKQDPFDPGFGNNTASGEPATSGVTGATTFSLKDDPEDLISSTSFDKTITITFSASGDASVSGDEDGIVTVQGNGVTVRNSSSKVKYILKGTTSNGFFKVYSDKKQAIVLDGVSITNPSGAAINNQCKKRCYVVLIGSSILGDGTSYDTPDGEDEKGAFFSEGQLLFSGDGSLDVLASGKSGIVSDDYVHIMDGVTVTVNSAAGHGIRGKDAVLVSGGTVDVTVSADMKKAVTSDSLVAFNGGNTILKVRGGTAYDDEDAEYKGSAGVKADKAFVMNAGTLTITNSGQGGKGISCDGAGYFQGGSLYIDVTGTNYGSSSGGGFGPKATTTEDTSTAAKGIKCDGGIYISDGVVKVTAANHEAIESKDVLHITGGTVLAKSKDDAINSAGDMVIIGGQICAYSTGNDGLDANGNLFMEGGVVYAIASGSPEVALDANTEGGTTLSVNGGVLFALGGLESGSVLSQSCWQATWSSGTWYSMTVDGKTYCFKTPSSGGSGLVVSASSQPTLLSGVTVSGGTELFDGMALFDGSATGGSEVSLSSYSGGFGGFGGPGGMGGPGGFPGR